MARQSRQPPPLTSTNPLTMTITTATSDDLHRPSVDRTEDDQGRGELAGQDL